MKISDGLTINILQYIDRIDRIYPGGRYGEGLGLLRIVDYKTGSDKTDFSDIDELFNPETDHRRKAILQLMFYCNAYAGKIGFDGPIMPQIYSFKTMSTTGLQALKYQKNDFTDYRTINKEFIERFNATLTEMFDPNVPFTQAVDDSACKFCGFKPICRKH